MCIAFALDRLIVRELLLDGQQIKTTFTAAHFT